MDAERFIAFLKDFADDEYVAGCTVAKRSECLGWEAKSTAGKFGKAEMDAHTTMNKHFGAHHGIYAAIKYAIAKEKAKS